MKRVPIAARFAGLVLLSMAVAACALLGPSVQPAVRAAGAPDNTPLFDQRTLLCEASGPLEPLSTPAPPPAATLLVPGFPDAVVAEPIGEAPLRPVVIALHGLGGRPEPHCDAWRNITGGAAFVLCPRGDYDPQRSTPSDRRYTLAGGGRLQHHLAAALRALADRFGGRVDVTRPLLAGFSLGAVEAALFAQKYAAEFPRVALLDGGLDQWPQVNIDDFASHGGQRVLFGCGSEWCPSPAAAASQRIEHSGLRSRFVHARVGHTNAPALQAAVREALPWLLSGDARWSQVASPEASPAEP